MLSTRNGPGCSLCARHPTEANCESSASYLAPRPVSGLDWDWKRVKRANVMPDRKQKPGTRSVHVCCNRTTQRGRVQRPRPISTM